MSWNIVFQYYLKLVRDHAPKSLNGVDYIPWIRRSLKRGLRFARLVGKTAVVIAGDSNGFTINSMKERKSFRGILVNISIPGTRFDEWIDITSDSEIAEMMNDPRVRLVWNLGGNHVLGADMKDVSIRAATIAGRTPGSWNVTIPPLPSGVMDFVTRQRNPNAAGDFEKMNEITRKYWTLIIDVAALFDELMEKAGLNRDAYALCADDGIHYKDWFDLKVRIPLIRTAIGDA